MYMHLHIECKHTLMQPNQASTHPTDPVTHHNLQKISKYIYLLI